MFTNAPSGRPRTGDRSTSAERSVSWLWVILVLLGVTFFATLRLNEGIWTDEARTLYYVGATPQHGPTTFTESWERLAENLWQAPGYYMVLKLWSMAVGQSVFVLRVLSLFWGLLALALVYRMAKYYFSAQVAWYAVFVMGMNAFYINFTHDMRTYTQIVMLVLVLLALYERLRRTAAYRWVGDVALTLVVSAMLYTHYFTVFPIAVMFFYYSIVYREHIKPRRLFIAHLIGAVTFLPWVNVFLGGLLVATTDLRQIRNYGLIDGLGETLRFFGNGNIMMILLALAVVRLSPSTRRAGNAMWILLVGMFFAIWLVTRFFPIFIEIRYILYVWPFLAMLTALGIDQLDQRGVPNQVILAVWGVVFVGSLLSTREQLRIHEWDTPPFPDLQVTMQSHLRRNDALIWTNIPLARFTSDDMLEYYLHPYNGNNSHVIQDKYATTDEHYAAEVAAAADGHAFVWVAHDTANWTWRLGEIAKQLENDLNLSACGTLPRRDVTQVDLFARPHTGAATYAFSVGGGQTATVDVLREVYLVDGAIYAVLGWERPSTLNTLSVGLHIEGTDGAFIGSEDIGMSSAGYQCGIFHVEVAAAQVDDVVARLVVYDWQTGQRFSTSEGETTVERPVLGTLSMMANEGDGI